MNNYTEEYSVIIITDGDEPEKLERLKQSIISQNFPVYEIIVVRDEKRTGKLGALRNAGCRIAKYYNLIVLDDDMILHADFYPGLVKYRAAFGYGQVLSCRILNPDNTRYWDWKAHEGGKNWLLDYGETDERVSITGGLCILNKSIFDKVQWDETRGFNEEEDVDFTERLKKAGVKIELNPFSTVTHDGPYTQFYTGVMKLQR